MDIPAINYQNSMNKSKMTENDRKTNDIIKPTVSEKINRFLINGSGGSGTSLLRGLLNAHSKLEKKQLDMIAANWVGERAAGAGFNSDENALQLFWVGGERSLARCSKVELAKQLLAAIAEQFGKQD